MDKEQEYDENGRPVKKKNKDVKNKDTINAVDPQQKLKGDKLGEDARAMSRSGRASGREG